MDNLAGIPILQQHGGKDHNVPTYHSRRLKQLITESDWTSQYAELDGKGHWFDGIMTTQPLRKFYRNISEGAAADPELPENFSVIIPNSGDMGSRGGILVDQLTSPDQLGKINVVRSRSLSKWTLLTSNIHRLHFVQTVHSGKLPDLLEIDDSSLNVRSFMKLPNAFWLIRSSDGAWTVGLFINIRGGS